MIDIVYLNGVYIPAAEAQISIFDRGFLFADSLYEVIPFYQGRGFRLQEHLQRLQRGLEAVEIDLQLNLEAICNEVVARNGGGNQGVYIQITRGAGRRRTQTIDPGMAPTVLVHSYPIQPSLVGDLSLMQGIAVVSVEDIRWQRCDIKTNGLMANILALQQAHRAGAQEAIMLRDEQVTEGTSSNVFIVSEGQILTPGGERHAILGGTTRSLILELAALHQLPCREAAVSSEALFSADEVWISSSTRAAGGEPERRAGGGWLSGPGLAANGGYLSGLSAALVGGRAVGVAH